MKEISVHEGDTVKMGTFLGLSGNTGKSTGPHLHYEVIYKDRPVNPYNYFDLSMDTSDYMSLVNKVKSGS